MLKKISKEAYIKYFSILGIALLLCQNFLQMHYSSDTYVLYDLGYMAYPSKYFLLDGRLISAIVCYIAGFIKIPIPIYIIGMDFLGIIFIATSIFMFNIFLEKLLKPSNIYCKLAITASCFILILNQFTLEYLLFPESAVMCLGLLLNVIAIKIVIESKKHKYLKVFICLLISTICYQGLLNIFPVFAILIYIVKQMVDEREYKIKEKEFFLEMIKLAIIVILVLAISMSIVNISKKMLNSTQDRNMHLINFEAVLLRGETVLEFLDELWNNQMHMLPKHTYNMVLVVTFIVLIALKTQKEFVMQFVLLLVIVFTICTVPMFIFNTGICARVNNPLMMIWGVSLIILLTQSKINNKCMNIIYIFVIISFIVNSIFIMQNITEHIASNRVEENMGRTIKKVIEDYEENTGIKVTKFGYIYDLNPQQHAVGIKPMQSLTERKLACSWSIRYAMNFYCERKFEPVGISIKTYEEKIPKKDFKEFSEEQIIFDNDAVYLIVY